jgi:CubicO group peptidase (beta-lactamase class C family)
MSGPTGATGLDKAALAKIPQDLQAVIDLGGASGFVTLVWRKGEVAQLNMLGLRNVARGEPMTRDTLFRIASMTKPITSLAALMLMEEGKLRLEDPISKWLPEFAAPQVLADPAGPLDQVTPARRAITVEDLLTHRAGLAYGFSAQGPLARAYEERLGSPILSPLAPDPWLAALASLPLAYQPGERMHYSHATDVLGFLIARAEGSTLGQVLRRRIFDPLGMTDTAFWIAPDKRDRLARLYERPVDGGPLQDVSAPPRDEPPAFEGGGGGLTSSLDDYLTFARLMLGRGEVNGVRLVRPETIDLMTANRLTQAQRAQTFLSLPYWESMGFGLGVSTIMDAEKHLQMGAGAAGSFGWPGAFGTWWQADPRNEMILIYLVQFSVPLTAEVITATRDPAPSRVAAVVFQKLAYAALRG